MAEPYPDIKSKHSLVAKYVTEPLWEKLNCAVTKTSGFSLAKAIACAVEFDNQGWKFMSYSSCQELGQQASWLLIGYTGVNN